MNNKNNKHKRIIKQRILTIIITLFILTVLSVGIYYATQVFLLKYRESEMNKPDIPAETVSEEETENLSDQETPDDWYVPDDDSIEDDYGDVPDIEESRTVSSPELSKEDEEIENIIAKMSLKEKAAQLFIITPEALTGVDTVTAAGPATKEALQKKPAGGLIYFQKNIEDPNQLKTMLSNTYDYAMEISSLPPFLCVDEEGGRVTRLASNESFELTVPPAMWDIGLSENAADDAYYTGNNIGKYLKEYGFNVDFAPDADIVTSSENSAIGNRSFGSDPDSVARLSSQYAAGLKDSGIIACFKHFPGLGESETDTHTGAASLKKSLTELKENELIPFENAITNEADMIMVGHISCPLVTGDETPSSLSSVMISEILRDDLGYDGIVITDSLMMQAVTDTYAPDEAALAALDAGADILLMPADFDAALDALINAVKSGRIKEERINDSLRRILRIKTQMID